jgi:hypothetical protein
MAGKFMAVNKFPSNDRMAAGATNGQTQKNTPAVTPGF